MPLSVSRHHSVPSVSRSGCRSAGRHHGPAGGDVDRPKAARAPHCGPRRDPLSHLRPPPLVAQDVGGVCGGGGGACCRGGDVGGGDADRGLLALPTRRHRRVVDRRRLRLSRRRHHPSPLAFLTRPRHRRVGRPTTSRKQMARYQLIQTPLPVYLSSTSFPHICLLPSLPLPPSFLRIITSCDEVDDAGVA